MIRYTTPTIPFEIEADFSLAEVIVSFVQDCVQLDKVIDDYTVADGITTFNVELSQEETARFDAGKPVHVQVNAIFPDGIRVATNIQNVKFFENLLDQVVEYDD